MADANSIPRRMQYRKWPLPSDAELYAEAHRVYEYKDGELTWKFKQRGRRLHGRVGGNDGNGYLMCMLLGHKVKVHQVVWLMHHAKFPKIGLDHIDRDRRNNRIENLRLASDRVNQLNRTPRVALPGVTKNPRGQWYYARIVVGGKKLTVGKARTAAEASAMYEAARRALIAVAV